MGKPVRRSREAAQSQIRSLEAIKIVNATFAMCVGKDLDTEARRRAFFVYQVRKGVFYIPATRSEYRILRKVQANSDARRARATFFKALSIPGHSVQMPAIRLQMLGAPHEILTQSECALRLPLHKKIDYYPDSSIRFPRLEAQVKYPFLVVEVAVTQAEDLLNAKIHRYIQGSKSHLKFLCIVRLRYTEGDETTSVTLTVTKSYKYPVPTAEQPDAFQMRGQTILDKVEVFPRMPTQSFDIALSDTLPAAVTPDPAHSSQKAIIPLSLFYYRAQMAVAHFGASSSEASSTFDSDQQRIPTPPSSRSNLEDYYPESEPDDSEDQDPSYIEGE
ncbi:MAG: hypothetical protein Q9163_004869 [Psora crenata]